MVTVKVTWKLIQKTLPRYSDDKRNLTFWRSLDMMGSFIKNMWGNFELRKDGFKREPCLMAGKLF